MDRQDKPGQYFSIGRFRERLYRPDVIDQLLVHGDEGAAIQAANDQRATALAAATSPSDTQASSPPPSRPTPDVTQPTSERQPGPSYTAKDLLRELPATLVYRQAPLVAAQTDKVTLDFGLLLKSGDNLTSLVVRRTHSPIG